MTWTAEDHSMAELRAWLLGQGFIVLSDRFDPDAFGNQVVEIARPVGVRLTRDRGSWTVEIAGPDGAWTSISDWRESIEGPAGPPAPDAAEQAALLRVLLPEIERRTRT